MEWYLAALQKYAQFSGRSRRKEYWFFVLFNVLVSIALSIVDRVLGLTAGSTGVLSTLYAFAVLIPGLAVAVRRLHDTGRSGWWILIAIIPILGWIAYLVFMFQDSEPGTNQYGPNPKAGDFAPNGVALS